ncbi:MAG: HEAT repeat domain-containing protein, partial [Candidatus Marinimicrobia bacterium]|nr:HEAT repeat domain-containing protein [Candidatus Neomarinimicrobiota bacterium]
TDAAIDAAMPVLLGALEDPNNYYAKMAVISLGELGLKAGDAVPSVRQALKSVDPDTRTYAAIALADIGDTEFATNALAELIQDKELHGRHLVLKKLSSLGSQANSAIPVLINLLLDDADKRYGDRALAAVALNDIDPNNSAVVSALRTAWRDKKLSVHLQKRGLLPE